VILPKLFLPPLFFKVTSSDFSGLAVVISAKAEQVWCLRPGEVGL
jgi:hypothetical protein